MKEIRLTQTIDAPLDRIWRACATARGLSSWQADEALGELSPGELLTLRWPALGVELELEVEDVIESERVVLSAVGSRLELALAPGQVTLVQSGVGEGDESEGVASSWRLSLGILAHYCERHFDSPRHVRWLARPARTSTETAHVFFTDAAALGSWLGNGGPIGAPGTPYAIDLGAGERLSGKVLANTPGRDLAITWEEDEGSVLCLRTLPRPLAPGERLIVLSWSRWTRHAPERSALERLDAAHHRLTRALAANTSA